MSETSRKRSRKSKLVPRVCTEAYEDDNVDLQLPVEKYLPIKKVCRTLNHSEKKETPLKEPTTYIVTKKFQKNLLERITAPAKETVDPTSPIKFDIKVEVESCEDFQINSEDNEKNYSTIIEPSQDIILVRDKNASHSERNLKNLNAVLCIPYGDQLNAITLSEEKILQEADKIMRISHNRADKILDICVRNTIGHELKGKLYSNSYEDSLQEALNDWRSWQSRSLHRESPLFYKCYVCEKSWWYLSEFRDHIAQHIELNIALETYDKHEANIIAYSITIPEIKNIHTDGLCYRCGKGFEAHKMSPDIKCKYNASPGCNKQFYTCSSLRDHFTTCKLCPTSQKNYLCGLCKTKFFTEDLLIKHLQFSHTVRSDIPICVRYKNCKECSGRYCCNFLHICSRQGLHTFCRYCFKSFPNKYAIEMHMDRACEQYLCEICRVILPWNCMKYTHMMEHTDKYVLVWKCVQCDDYKVYLSRGAALQHRYLDHNTMNKGIKHLNYFNKIIVPKSCIYQSLEKAVPQIEELEPAIADNPEIGHQKVVEECPNENNGMQDNPQDFEVDIAASLIAIKDEPFDNDDTEFIIEEKSPSINVPETIIKQENNDEEIDEYEDDIIKLNIDFNDHFMVKQETEQTEILQANNDSQESVAETLESVDNTTESGDGDDEVTAQSVKQESILEPEVIIQRKRKRIYVCNKCGFEAKHREFKDHLHLDCKRAESDKSFPCTKCSVEFPTMKKYLAHFVLHGFQGITCPVCDKAFYSFTKLTPHVQSHIKNNFVRVKLITTEGPMLKPEYQCKICCEIVETVEFFDHWESHVKSSPENPVEKPRNHQMPGAVIKELLTCIQSNPKTCNHCHRTFKRVNECKRHLIEHLLSDAYSHKTTLRELRCQLCGSGFVTAERYKQHMRDHASLPVYKCELCDHSFSDSSNFTKHKKVHNFKVFVCDLCGKKFQAKLSLEKHLEAHSTTEPIKCEICNKIYHFESTYRRHLRYSHERVNLGLRCVICSERFETLKLKWNHMWEVHKERKHKADCPICGKSFRKYQDVRIHARIEHNTEVSVFSMKYTEPSVKDIENILQNKTDFKIGAAETLVIYE